VASRRIRPTASAVETAVARAEEEGTVADIRQIMESLCKIKEPILASTKKKKVVFHHSKWAIYADKRCNAAKKDYNKEIE